MVLRLVKMALCLSVAACATNDAEPAAEILEDAVAEVDASDIATTAEAIEDVLVIPPERQPGERAPLTARCDDSEPAACFLPWPSTALLARDDNRETGLVLRLAPDELAAEEGIGFVDGVADGFSRVTPIVHALPLGAETGSVSMHLFVAEPGEHFAAEVPVDAWVAAGRDESDRSVLIGYPLAPLAAASEHLVVVVAEGFDAFEDAAIPLRSARIALGEVEPETPQEAARFAYFAPARTIVDTRGLERRSVVALWDFVTRSAEDPRGRLRALAADARARIDDGRAPVSLTSITFAEPPLAMIVEGEITDLADDGATDASNFAVPFRVVVPAGAGDYPLALYGHGAGGDVGDSSFDELITGGGAAKVNVEIDGWTGSTLGAGVGGLLIPIAGTEALTARMRRAIAGIAAIQRAVEGPLGELLAAPTILGQDNPTAGRRPSAELPIWTGGSLGGVIGCVYGHLEPSIVGGVLNVPGAAFTHWIARSSIGGVLDLALKNRYPAMLDQQLVAAMSQTLWDEVDGAAWADAREVAPIWLVQMSVGDPIMPNNATAMVATATSAVMLLPEGASPMVEVPTLTRAPVVQGQSGFQEFRTHETSNSAIHGFTARDSPAGIAARAQVEHFIRSLWAGAPEIRIPVACDALPQPGVCDFSHLEPTDQAQ